MLPPVAEAWSNWSGTVHCSPRRIATPPLRLVAVERFGAFAELRYALPGRTDG